MVRLITLRLKRVFLFSSLGGALLISVAVGSMPAHGQASPAQSSPTASAKLFRPEELNTLPPAVWFSGKSASLQVRNSGGVHFGDGLAFWAALVDTSGYASNVQEKYQFYLVTEAPVHFGGKLLPAGAYGAGFVPNNRFVVMDVGGHTILEGVTAQDEAMKRPRPLQLVMQPDGALRLYLGRRYVTINSGS